MSIFNLHAQVLADYRDFVRSFFTITDERARQFVEHALIEEARLWPDFLLQVSPAYVRLATVDELAAQGVLREETARIFRTPEDRPFHLYQHQIEALDKARHGESYVVTSGTGSGKSLTYFLPIVDTLVRQPATGERVAALVVYPMNALVNSQLQVLEKLKEGYERRTGWAFPVTFAKFTGETNDTAREALRQHPPQILLTNYVMAERLAQETGRETEGCAARVREILNRGGMLARDDGGRAFAFKLHQFIGQGRALFATLEAADQREFSLEGQVQAGGGRLFAPVKFCRQCGQDYYHVLRADARFLPHPVGTESEDDESHSGYLMLAPADNDWSEERIPEEWRDARGRLKQTWRARVPQALWVMPDGDYSTQSRQDTAKMWWQAAPFSLCLTCGEFYTAREREFGKLASLSSEARSSATTVLTTALLRHAVQTEVARDKLLSFTDNRQDASLQAGHFNDFVHVSLLRCALYAALLREQELTCDRVAREAVLSCGLTIRDIARNPELDPQSSAAQEVWRVFTELTEYRLYEDLRRGWRVVQPNLEHVGLLRVG